MNRSASRLSLCGAIFDASKKRAELAKSEELIASPDFWNDSERSQKVMQDRKRLEKSIGEDAEVGSMTEELDTFFELFREGEPVHDEIVGGLKKLTARLEELETGMLLSGENDSRSAILTIHPGAGGTESQDWAGMLQRMYTRLAERRGMKVELIDYHAGEQAGIKSATLLVKGENAYGFCKAERGVHRLVRISPFDSNKRRHTSFSSVDVIAEISDITEADIVIPKSEILRDTFRSGGKGGQNVRELQRTTSSIIKLPEQGATTGEETTVHIIGNFFAVQSAQRRIRAMMNQQQQQGPGGSPGSTAGTASRTSRPAGVPPSGTQSQGRGREQQ